MNLVIVDDEKLIRQGLTFIISQISSRYKIVAQCKNGLEALNFCLRDSSSVQLVITDVRMPEMDGLELITELKKQRPNIHTLVMSGYDEFDYVLKALRIGAHDYLLKPIDKIELITLLERIYLMGNAGDHEPTSLPETYRDVGYVQTIVHDNLLNGLIQKDPGLTKDARVYLEENHGVHDNHHAYLMVGLIIDEMPQRPLHHADRVLFQYFIRKMTEEFLTANYSEKTIVFQGNNGIVYICFFLSKGCSDDVNQVEILDKLLKTIKQHIVYPITIGISSITASINDFAVLEEQIQAVIRARLILGSGIVLHWSAVKNLRQHYDLPDNFIKQMLNDIASKDKDSILTNVSTFLKQLRAKELQPELAIELIIRLFLRVSGELQAKMTDQGFVDALTKVKELWDKGTFDPAGMANGIDETQALFTQQKLAQYMVVPENFVKYLQDNTPKDVELGAYTLPAWKGINPSRTLGGAANLTVVSANTAHKDEAIKLTKFLTSEKIFQLLAKEDVVPSTKGYTPPAGDLIMGAYAAAAENGFIVDHLPAGNDEFNEKLFKDAIPRVLLKNLDPLKVLTELQAILDKAK